MACCLEWKAPRIDAPQSTPVRHVCNLSKYHDSPCRCSCGAVREWALRAIDHESPLDRP